MADAGSAALVQLLWDFHGPAALSTATHFLRHLRERCGQEGWTLAASGTESAGVGHCAAWCAVHAALVPALRAAMRPQRGLPWSAPG